MSYNQNLEKLAMYPPIVVKYGSDLMTLSRAWGRF